MLSIQRAIARALQALRECQIGSPEQKIGRHLRPPLEQLLVRHVALEYLPELRLPRVDRHLLASMMGTSHRRRYRSQQGRESLGALVRLSKRSVAKHAWSPRTTAQ